MTINSDVERIGNLILEADALLISTGAGMGVASGLQTIRGVNAPSSAWASSDGRHQFSYHQMATPEWFEKPNHSSTTASVDSVNFGYGFWRQQWRAFRMNEPHVGYSILNRWASRESLIGGGSFIFTSNVDGHHERSGFPADRIYECHGSITSMQCINPCSVESLRPSRDVEWDALTLTEAGDCVESESLPTCDECGGIARPNILLFYDASWLSEKTSAQGRRYDEWLKHLEEKKSKLKLVILEIGAGITVPTVRHESSNIIRRFGATLIRINPEHSSVPDSPDHRHMGVAEADSVGLLMAVDKYISANNTSGGQ